MKIKSKRLFKIKNFTANDDGLYTIELDLDGKTMQEILKQYREEEK